MENIMISVLLLVIIVLAIRPTIKHFKGEGGCCGGGSAVKRKPKKLKHVIARKTVFVEGMTCAHCKDRVERSIDAIDGAAGKVNLKKKQLLVSMEREISEEQIRTAVEQAGYHVVGIQ